MKNINSPWEHRRWRDGICRPDLGGRALILWFIALAFGGALAGIALKSPDMLHFSRMHWKILIPCGLALVSFLFMVGALISTSRWLRFRGCRVRLGKVPGVIGGHFRGEVMLPESFPADIDVRMELVCETTTTTPGKGSESNDMMVVFGLFGLVFLLIGLHGLVSLGRHMQLCWAESP